MPRTAGIKNRPFPGSTLKEALRIAQTIQDQNAGSPMNRLLLADAMGLSPAGSQYKTLLSSSAKYGLTKGTEKATDVALTEIGDQATSGDPATRQSALRRAARTPSVFGRFFEQFDQAKLPSDDMRPKILAKQYDVPDEWAGEGADLLLENGRFAGLIRDLTGGPRVMLDAAPVPIEEAVIETEADSETDAVDGIDVEGAAMSNGEVSGGPGTIEPPEPSAVEGPPAPKAKPIFVGHGKKEGPLETIEKFLVQFGIPHKVAVNEPNLGRPIPTKVREVMKECGTSILIFTKDERFHDSDGNEIWRPSENVIYELGAASFEHENRIVILMEKGLTFPANFESIGRIEFEEDNVAATASTLLQELINFGLLKVQPTG